MLAKYDSLNKIQISGYLVDLFRLLDSPRKDNQLGLTGYLNPIRDMEGPNIEELNPSQIDGGDDQPDSGEGHQKIDLSGRDNLT